MIILWGKKSQKEKSEYIKKIHARGIWTAPTVSDLTSIKGLNQWTKKDGVLMQFYVS